MENRTVNAMPTKELFIKTLVRDVSLTDAILDLIDNAVDGYIRKNYTGRKEINVKITENKFQIWDNCGGVDLDLAEKVVFRFGMLKSQEKSSLGVYGIGLKRAIFKLGSNIIFESDNLSDYFRVKIDVEQWQTTDDWFFDFDEIDESKGAVFTKISIDNIHNEVKGVFRSSKFKNELRDRISRTYFLFIEKNVDIYLDDQKTEPLELNIGFSENVEPANKSFEVDGVRVKLTAGAHPDYHNPGWYIFCNKRLIVVGDITSLTGWGERGVPGYHVKYNRFKGFAFLDSDDPTKLPWTTAKNNINMSSPIYIKVLNEMQSMTQQYTTFMTRAYPTEKEETIGKEILGDLRKESVFSIQKDQLLKTPPIPSGPRMTNISYKMPVKDVERVKECMGNKLMPNTEVGKQTFKYYKEMECPND